MLYEDITELIIKAFFKVNNTLGFGFLEKVYENAMRLELLNLKCKVEQQKQIKVFYEGVEIGDYNADLVVNDLVIVELKAAESLCKEHEAQLLNYLKATKVEVGLLLNFGLKAEFRRKIFTNDRK
jgi:GxxExxY protein